MQHADTDSGMRYQLKAMHEELKATRFALAFMGFMWVLTVGCIIVWTR